MPGKLLLCACVPLLAAGGLQGADFDAPVAVTAGGKAIDGYYYPTPVLQDLDGDGVRELVVGDLIGNVWICDAPEGDSDVAFGAARNMQALGKNLRLNNW